MILHSINDFLLEFSDIPVVRTAYREAVADGLSEYHTTEYLPWELGMHIRDCNTLIDKLAAALQAAPHAEDQS